MTAFPVATPLVTISPFQQRSAAAPAPGWCLVLSLLVLSLLAGCGTGGYVGGGITRLSATALTLDAGQSYPITATLAVGSPAVQWTLSGASCPAAGCGTLSSTTGGTITYTAPAGTTAPFQTTLTAAIGGTGNSSSVTITVNPDPMIVGTPPAGVVGQPYSTSITASPGTAPLSVSVVAGAPPPGLTYNAATGLLSGTPTAAGTTSFTVQVVDASVVPYTVSAVETVTITAPLTLAATTPAGTVGQPYAASLSATGGSGGYIFSLVSGSLPAGLSLVPATGAITGIPTAAGTFTFNAQVQDSAGHRTTGMFSITVGAPLTLATGTLPNGTVGTPYSSTIAVTGGIGPYTCTITGGILQAGLTLGANCLVSGTPTVAGTSNLTVKAVDSNGVTVSGPVSLTIAPATVLVIGNPPTGTAGTPYNGIIPVSGGTGPYTCTLNGGTLPAGLTLGAGCTVTGTPTAPGPSTITVGVTDSGKPPATGSGTATITINPAALTLTTGTLPNGTVGTPYSSTIGVTGGTGPYTCTITAGTLQAGLTLGANCLISGTPTVAGTSNLTVKAIDSSNPANSTAGPVSLTIASAPLTLSTGTLPNGTVGTPYSSTVGVTGGTGPYTCTITGGTLQAGLTLGPNCLISGTPTIAGTSNLTVKATDSSNPANSTTGPVSLTIAPAPVTLTIGTLPNGTVGTPYSSTLGVTGGTGPYTCTITGGTLQAGLTLGPNCLISGTPTVAGTSNLTVKATDSSNPVNSTTGPVSLTIAPATVLVIANPPAGTVNMPYNGTIPVSGGTGPYTCTLNAGTLPAGLTLGAGCTVTGTPTTSGPSTITVGVTDSSKPPTTSTGTATITINPASATLTLANPPAATVGTPYTGTIPVTGGTGPFTCTLNGGTVPAGLTLTNCTLTGTPSTAGTSTLTVTATDSSNPARTITGPVAVVVNPIPALTFTGSLPNAVVNQPYSQTLSATGGTGPYTYTTSAGALPPGLTLSAGGVVSGTPTAVGAYSFTATATDSEATPQTASLPLVILVTYAPTANDALLNGPYAFLFQGYDDVALGLTAYQTATAGSFTANGAGVLSAGELDANHQNSNPAGATISSNVFLGTYTIGADDRGLLTITTLNQAGTIAGTSTYAIAVKAPVAPATTAAQGSLIEFDNDQLAGTRGSGTFLQQTTASFTIGLTGSYSFGLQGDTPCLPTCTVNLTPGPVAAVGEFTVNAGTLTGQGDSNLAALQIVNQPLTGSYGTADGNGRIQLSLATAGTPTGFYPTDYALYMVNASQAFLLSTDKHSAAILLAGSAQSHTLATFNNTSLSGPFIGYENAPTNPGLVGATLNNTLDLSTATIFRTTANAAGTCTVTNVDQAGTTGLINGLTGLGSGSAVINAVLGSYDVTNVPAACPTAPNGRVVLNYAVPNLVTGPITVPGLGTPPPARIVYLTGVDRGFFLESGFAGLGQIEPQTNAPAGAPYTVASFNGSYLFLEVPASSVATTNTNGVIVANGQGSATTTEDLNTGVGTVNVLQLGVTGTFPYTAPDPTTGRFTLNGTIVIYEISPGRFVLVDTNPLLTSPSVILLD